MRFGFAGTPEFGAAVLQELLRVGRVPECVVTQPARPAGRGRRPRSSPVATLAERMHLPLIETPDINSAEVRAALLGAHVETLLVAAFGQMFREPLLTSFDCINVHASLLPAYRGAAPIVRALMAGEAQTGVCIMRMTEGLDEGPVAARSIISVGLWDDRDAVESALALVGAHAAAHVLDALGGGFVHWEPQGAPSTYAAKLVASDRDLDLTRPAAQVHDHVRALSPVPGATTRMGDLDVKLLRTWPNTNQKATAAPSIDGRPGEVAITGGRLFLGCGEGRVEILRIQPSGKRSMSAAEFVRGYSSSLSRPHVDQ
ncbi:MAG: methionyl-tRNA formyltransferase [Thermoleophilia bacterium]